MFTLLRIVFVICTKNSMKVLVFVNHPAQVHLFKNIVWKLQEHGHTVEIALREKDVALYLLEKYGFKYTSVGKYHPTMIGKGYELITTDYKSYKLARKFRPDILVDVGIYGAHTSKFIRKPSIMFIDDDRGGEIVEFLAIPFSDVVLTLASVRTNFAKFGKKEIRVNSFKELAYLHPNWFKPDKTVLSEAGISENKEHALLRFVSWTSYHDFRKIGLDIESKRRIIGILEDHGVVPYISSEIPLPEEFEKYRLPVPPEKLHGLLYYAKLLIGDSQTMTTEAACLGVPAIKCNDYVADDDSNFIELEKEYGAIFRFTNPDEALSKLNQLLDMPNLREQWMDKRRKILSDKIDLTSFMVWFIENYPESVREMRANPEIAARYKFRGELV